MLKFPHKSKVRKVPLTSIFISNSFTQVTIGLVGPSRTIDSRSQVHTLTECVTRFPEAIPLRNEDLVNVTENFIFCTVDMSNDSFFLFIFLSDRGKQFKSDLMKEVNRVLSIKAIFTSPYHAVCNGTVKRLHAVVESMLRKLCRKWGRLITSVLFASRELPNDPLKFSPFELLYGRRVRGPLPILYE